LRGEDDVTGAIATAPLAARFGLHPGEMLVLQTPRGALHLTVGGAQEDYADPLGTLIVARTVLMEYDGEAGADAVAIELRPDADPIAVRGQLESSVLPMRVEIRTTRELRMQSLALFDRTFALGNGLGVLSLAIAVVGIATTLGGLVLERRREIGILRYVGATRAFVQNMIVSEATLIGLTAVAIGLFAGFWLALVQLVLIDRRTFGWSIPLHVPFVLVAAVIGGALVASIGAALYPARIASRIASDVASANA
jgi:putative ABC transport system permease protein